MKRIAGLVIMLVLSASFSAIAQETFTLTTYYPAPFGIYQRIVTQTLGVGDNNPNVPGVDATDAPDPTVADQAGDVWIAGNVRIGTTTPSSTAKVEISSGITEQTLALNRVGELGAHPDIEFRSQGNLLGSIGFFLEDLIAGEGGYRIFTTTGGNYYERFRIRPNGNVGIGTVNPQATLDVAQGYILPPRHDADPATADSREGMIYYSTALKQLRVFDGTAWKNVAGNVQMASGMFYGDGSGWRTITTGFRPRIVMLLPHGQGPYAYSDNLILKMDSWPTSEPLSNPGSSQQCGICYWTANYIKDAEGYDNPSCTTPECNTGVGYGIHILPNGFETNINTNTRPYSWIAFGY